MDVYAERNLLLAQLGYKNYDAYLRSSEWKEIRARKLAQDPNCFGCNRNADKATMQVHHGAYTQENLSGAALTDLWTVCSRCHRYIEVTSHGYKRTPEQATDELRRIRRLRLHRARVKVDNRLKCRP